MRLSGVERHHSRHTGDHMTYDPERDARAPADVNPNTRPHERLRSGNGMPIMLGLLALLLIGGFLFYSMSRETKVVGTPGATTGIGAPSTARDSGTGINPNAAPKPGPAPAAPASKQ